jgi:hypothetical protein
LIDRAGKTAEVTADAELRIASAGDGQQSRTLGVGPSDRAKTVLQVCFKNGHDAFHSEHHRLHLGF